MGKLFGTDGLRGKAGEFPLDFATVELLGRILFFQLREKPEIIIGRDTRESGPRLFDALSSGFGKSGGKIHDAGIISTPALAFLAGKEKKFAIALTASHNAYKDNGIKIFGPDGLKLMEATETEIEPYLLGEKTFDQAPPVSQKPEIISRQTPFQDEYCSFLVEELFRDLRLDGMKIALDCANGALYKIAPEVLKRFGAEVTAIGTEPDGKNINAHCGSLYPEVLSKELNRTGYDIGFTFDGDGDRCIIVDEKGIYDGDYILATAGRYLQSIGRLNKNAVVGTAMSNVGLEIYFKQLGITLHRVPVGDKYVLEKLQSEQLSLGGEQSGHIIFMNDSFIGDGLMTALQILQIYRSSGVQLSALCDGFVKYPQILLNIPVLKKPELTAVPEIQERISALERDLQNSGRILVRYSGTEMVARVMIEGEDQQEIEKMASGLGEIIRKKLN